MKERKEVRNIENLAIKKTAGFYGLLINTPMEILLGRGQAQNYKLKTNRKMTKNGLPNHTQNR